MLLDFDGPICDIFAGLPAPEVAARLRRMLKSAGVTIPEHVQRQDDPLEVFRFSASLSEELNKATSDLLTALEVKAASTARPTPGALDLLRDLHKKGKPVAIVSNNSAPAVAAYLETAGILWAVKHISARASKDPRLMKPNPYLVRQALYHLEAAEDATVLVGDSTTDMEVCKSTNITAVGFVNRPSKEEALAAAGADLLITSMTELSGPE
ncbi:HAD family hydrolase [Microbispora sp. NEAU-D428]|uniref:HAD family hydrolase n=1 Tax=Microbispora sitophila TaxID=2771537 RepID=UPI001866B651|nr:HAD hydrolase-like protein [Microbispora sitophila]MBE3016314.1 HAD family hydrolase [Microbispora sitophila]